MISQEKAVALARKYHSKVDFITRLAAFAEQTGKGANPFEVLRDLGIEDGHTLVRRYRLWAERLAPELAEADTASELATPSGDVLADTAVRPTWEPWTAAEDPEAHRDQADYDTPNDEGDDQQ